MVTLLFIQLEKTELELTSKLMQVKMYQADFQITSKRVFVRSIKTP